MSSRGMRLPSSPYFVELLMPKADEAKAMRNPFRRLPSDTMTAFHKLCFDERGDCTTGWPTCLEESDYFLACQSWNLNNWNSDERAAFNRAGHALTPMMSRVVKTREKNTASGQAMISGKIGMVLIGSRYAVEMSWR